MYFDCTVARVVAKGSWEEAGERADLMEVERLWVADLGWEVRGGKGGDIFG